jgi:hypothetical protein
VGIVIIPKVGDCGCQGKPWRTGLFSASVEQSHAPYRDHDNPASADPHR